MPSFALYLIAVFCSPVYFALRKRWGGFVFNLALYLSAILFIAVFFVGVIPWMIGVAHAFWYIRIDMMEHAMQRQAELIAKQMNKV